MRTCATRAQRCDTVCVAVGPGRVAVSRLREHSRSTASRNAARSTARCARAFLIPSGASGIAALDGLVQQSVAQLCGFYQILPDFVPAPAEGIKMMRAARAVPDVFPEASAVAAENDASMQATTGLDPVKTRLGITRNLRFEPLAAAAEALARDVRYNIFRERWDVVQQALHVYNLAKGYTRNARAASLVAHVKTMQPARGRSGHPCKTKPAPPPTPKQK